MGKTINADATDTIRIQRYPGGGYVSVEASTILQDFDLRQEAVCACPELSGIRIRGSSCSLHGLPHTQWDGGPDAMQRAYNNQLLHIARLESELRKLKQ